MILDGLSKVLLNRVFAWENVQYSVPIPVLFIYVTHFIMTIILSFLAGWIYDITQKYDFSFYICGMLYLVGIIFLLIQPCIQKKEPREKHTENAQV